MGLSHKEEKRRNYIRNAKQLNMLRRVVIIKLQKKFHVVVKGIRERRQSKLKIFEPSLKPKNKKLERGGRKPLDL